MIDLGPLEKFQSHFGSIKTETGRVRERQDDWFQSHFGSIKTDDGLRKKYGGRNSFNPTLVRLKPEQSTTHGFGDQVFQSHFGSIKTPFASFHVVPRTWFQSHFGSIKTEKKSGEDSKS